METLHGLCPFLLLDPYFFLMGCQAAFRVWVLTANRSSSGSIECAVSLAVTLPAKGDPVVEIVLTFGIEGHRLDVVSVQPFG
jgi:hypothetical protein